MLSKSVIFNKNWQEELLFLRKALFFKIRLTGLIFFNKKALWPNGKRGKNAGHFAFSMRGFIYALTVVVLLLSLDSCASSQAPYVPSVSFECRLSIWPTFDPPVEYLIQTDSAGRSAITEFRYRGAGGYAPKRSGAPIVYPIASKQWGNFIESVRKHDPWSIPSKQPYMNGLDGTIMIFEIRDGERYHRVKRWAPFGHKSENRFVDVAISVIKLLPKR